MNPSDPRPLAIVTGASSGIGFELARCCAQHGYDLILAADRPLEDAAAACRSLGADVEMVQTDLSTTDGVDTVVNAVNGRPVAALLANAGQTLGHGFLDQDFADARQVLDTNITGTLYLLHRIVGGMRDECSGKVLITGSIAGFTPGPFQAVYNSTKAFLNSFAAALRNELKDSGVTVTCLMPGLTDTDVFARGDMLDTRVGASSLKADPADVAKTGFDAMQAGEADVVAGVMNKLVVAGAKIMPTQLLAEVHRKMAEPGSASSK